MANTKLINYDQLNSSLSSVKNYIDKKISNHGIHVTWATNAPAANGTASAGTVARVAREDHVHPLQTTISGQAGTATRLATARTLTIGNTGKSFNGSADVSWSLSDIGALPLTGGTITGRLAISGYSLVISGYSKDIKIGTGPDDVYIQNTASNKHLQLKDDGTLTYSNNAIYHAGNPQVNITGNAATATKLKTARTFTFTGAFNGNATFDGSENCTITTIANVPSSGAWFNNGTTKVSSDGVMKVGKYIDFHNTNTTTADYDTRIKCGGAYANTITLPSATGTLALISDNVNSATKLKTARTLTIGNTGKSFDGSANASWSLSEIGAYSASGGTLNGVINSSQMSGTWVAACKNGALINSSKSTAGTFAAMMSGKTTNGSMALAFYNNEMAVAYLTAANVSSNTNTTSCTCVLMDENGNARWPGTVKAGKFDGPATKADTLSTARTIAVSGDVTGSVSFNGSSNVTIDTERRRCSVGQINSTTTNPYYKVASMSTSESYIDYEIVFKVNTGYSQHTKCGILKAHFRTNSAGTGIESAQLQWEYACDGIVLSDFVLAHSASGTTPTAEVWVKISTAYMAYQFEVLAEHNRLGKRSNRRWTLYNTLTAGSQSAITSGYTQIQSTYLGLNTGKIVANNTITGTKVYNAVYNDYAEWFERKDLDEYMEPGDILIWDKTGVTKSTKPEDNRVVGVFSDNYGHIIGGEQLDDMENNIIKYAPIGLAGRLDVKVIGPIEEGDLIMSSDIPGVGMRSDNEKLSTIIGKALEDYDGKDGIKRIKVLIFGK